MGLPEPDSFLAAGRTSEVVRHGRWPRTSPRPEHTFLGWSNAGSRGGSVIGWWRWRRGEGRAQVWASWGQIEADRRAGLQAKSSDMHRTMPKSFIHKSTRARLDLLTGSYCDSKRVRTTLEYDERGTNLGPMESSLGIVLSGLVVCLILRLTALSDLAKASQGCLTCRQVVSWLSSVICPDFESRRWWGRRRKCSGMWLTRRKGNVPWKSPSYGNLPHIHSENCGRNEAVEHDDEKEMLRWRVCDRSQPERTSEGTQ
jgi:hypothetical protein